ncbi:MAG: hypothetical protein ACO3UW_10755 [Candidatus Nanopelagicales bacterium]
MATAAAARDPALTERIQHLDAALVAVLRADAIASTVLSRRVLAALVEEIGLVRKAPSRIGSNQAAVLGALRRGPLTAVAIERELAPAGPTAGALDEVLARLVERRLIQRNEGFGPYAATYQLTTETR